MATMNSDTNEPSVSSSVNERRVWYYNVGDSSNTSWIPFADIDNEIVDEAFSKNRKKLELDDYYIDLDKCIQINKQESSIQRSIKRCICKPHEAPLRSERFYVSQKLVKSFNDNDSNDRRFINEWRRRYKNMSINEKLQKAADGIRKEGILLGKNVEADWIAQQLCLVKNKPDLEVGKCIIELYTHESFLYRLVNTTLRENDQSKVDTLGAFAQLLFQCDCSSFVGKLGYAEELYRGAQLDEQTIESYKQAIGQTKTWDAFSSTSKNRKKATSFGNVLFIINRDKSAKYKFSGIDVSDISHYSDEEEVLIRAARNFIVENVEREDNTGKYLIFLSLI